MSTPSATTAHAAFTTTAPVADNGEIGAIMQRFYGMRCEVTPLTSERDLNVHIAADSGREYVLKIANAGEERENTAFQNRALEHITAKGTVPTPEVIRSLDGDAEIVVTLGGRSLTARLLTYLPGLPLWRSNPSPEQRHALGTTLGKLSQALRDFDHPAAAHDILWDLKNIPRLEELTRFIPDEARRTNIRRIIETFDDRIKPLEPRLRHQVVHNDYNPHNVLVDPLEHDRVTGVLDFGDMVKTPLIYDVAVACSYQVPETGHPLHYAAEFLAAFHSAYALFPEEVDLLYDLVCARNAMTITITQWRADLYPENSTYILRNNPRATLALKRLAETTGDEAREVFRSACRLA